MYAGANDDHVWVPTTISIATPGIPASDATQEPSAKASRPPQQIFRPF